MTDKKPQKAGHRSEGGERPPRRRAPVKAKPEPQTPKAFEGERIAKVMARAGACSRRDAEIWIAEGRVAVNGDVLESPAFNVREGDRIEVDGAPLAEREPTRLFLFHKPEGLVTSAKDPEGRDTVFGFLEERHPELPRLVSVGRLDINTEGLLLLTNDGGLARTLELPATGWTRRYRVRAHGEIDQARLDELRKGVTVDDVDYAPIEARLDRVQGANVWITMALREGKNREIKRVLEHLGLGVNRLIRISFGPFQLGELAEGAVEEVKLKILREQLGKGLAELAGVDFSSPRRETAEPEHVIEEERRQHAKTRARKHVSTLRAEVEESRGKKAPRARIERSATADRKGRAVAVETIKPVRRRLEEEAPPATRNARRFQAERGEGAEARPERAPPRRREAAAAHGADERRRAPRAEGRDGGAQQELRPRRPRPEGESRPRPEGRGNFVRRGDDDARRGESAERPRRPRPEGEARPRPDGRGNFVRRGGDDARRDERAERPRRPRPEGEARPRPEGRGNFVRHGGDDARRGESAERPRRPRPEGEARPRPEGRGNFVRRGGDDARRGESAEKPRRPRPEGEARPRPEGRGNFVRRGGDDARRGESAERPRRPRPEGEARPRPEGRGNFVRRGGDDARRDGERAERPRRPRPEGEAPAKRGFAKPRREDGKDARPRSGGRDGAERRGPPRDAPRGGKPGGKPRGGKPSGGKPAGSKPSGPRKPRERS